ncbi:MAG TPA: hypothetical protein VK881_15770 [bacterium]|nr:hypothetical protein [bacterium]
MRQRAGMAKGERGAVMIFVLMTILLVGAFTIGVIQVISGDGAGGAQSFEADQVFNIALAGLHYAIGRLQITGAGSYAGETVSIANGPTPLGTAAVAVNCIDTGAAPPCTGPYAMYRRIVSTGALPVSGPTRTVVAIVQDSGGNNGYGTCSYSSLSIVGPDVTTIKGDIGANGAIDMSSMNQPGTYVVAGAPGVFTGKAVAGNTIVCNGICGPQIQGGAFPNTAGAICRPLTLPPSSPGTMNMAVALPGFTMDQSTGFIWGDITVAAGGSSGACGDTYNTLSIHASDADPNAVTPVQIKSLTMGYCTRLAILGVGKIDLRIGSTTTPPTGNVLATGGWGSSPNDVHFGVTSADTGSVLAPVAPGRLTVWVSSTCTPPGCTCAQNTVTPTCAAEVSHIAGTAIINVPNGALNLDDSCPLSGTITANWVLLSGCADLDASGYMTTPTSFSTLRSWKDQ